jgi:hypothetical protein
MTTAVVLKDSRLRPAMRSMLVKPEVHPTAGLLRATA